MYSLQSETHGKAMCLNEKSGQICLKNEAKHERKYQIEVKNEQSLSLEEATF